MGHSAGAHLVSLAGTDERYLIKEGLSFKDIRAVISVDSGSMNVAQHMNAMSRGETPGESGGLVARRLKKMYGNAFGKDPAYWEKVSPYHYLKAEQSYPPFLILTVASRLDSTAQGRTFIEKLKTIGGTGEFYPIADRTHGSINKMFGAQGDESFVHTLEFLKKLD
jgi:acetyl esterase/lipase